MASIGDKLFGGKPKKPNTAQYEAENDRLLDELARQMPREYEELRPEDVAQLDASAMEGVSTDPALREAQRRALQRMGEVADKGYTAEEEAALSRIRRENAQADRGRREAIMQNMQARGMADSGASLAAQLQSAQAANEADSQQGLDVAANAQRRALQAIAQSGQMAGSMRNQDFSEQSDVARAKDAINQFNTQNRVRAQFNNNQGHNQFNQQQFQNRSDVANYQVNNNVNKANNAIKDWEYRTKQRQAKAGAIMGMAGAGAGAYFGGPAGAQTGAAMGSSMGSAFMSHGGKVGGPSLTPSDSPLNDIIPVQASAGEIVIPKSIAKSPEKAAKFVNAVNATEDEDLLALILEDIKKS